MTCSFHCELRSRSCEYLVGNCDFLDTAPVVLVAPGVAPSHKENHGDLRDKEATQEGLASNHREEKVGQ